MAQAIRVEHNGVNLDNVMKLVEAVKENPALAQVTFRAHSEWQGGTQTQVTISDLFAGGMNIARLGRKFSLTVDEPPELGGGDTAPNPVEFLAAGLCGCLTAGIATNAALFETDLDRIAVDVEVDFDIHGVLGLNKATPNGATELRYTVTLKGPAARERLVKSKETIDRKSPVKNTVELPLKIITDVRVED